MKRRAFLGSSFLSLLGPAGPAFAQDSAWPARPLRMVVAYPAGGSTDVAGRLLSAGLGRRLGQQVVVDNRPGAGGIVGATAVAKAEADGYTLLLAASPELSIAPTVRKSLPYDPAADFAPIAGVGQIPFVLVVNPALPVKTLAEFIAYARARPGQLAYSSFGNNTSNHVNGELLKSLAKIDTVHVPYKGSGPSIVDLIGGQVQYTLDGPPAVMEHVKAGRLRALAVAADKRLPSAPELPTFAEAGLPGFVAGTWFGLVAPARTPRAVVDRLGKDVLAELASPELANAFRERDILANGGSPEDFGRFIRAEVDKWKQLAGRLHLVAE